MAGVRRVSDITTVPYNVRVLVFHNIITDLPDCSGYDSILVVINHLTSLAHFIPCKSTITAKETAELFLKEIVRLHGIPRVIVSDRDPLFTSKFWGNTLRSALGNKLNMSRRAQKC